MGEGDELSLGNIIEMSDILTAIYHALEENDWERLKYYKDKGWIDELISQSTMLPRIFHPIIIPNEEAYALERAIDNQNSREALERVAALLISLLHVTVGRCRL